MKVAVSQKVPREWDQSRMMQVIGELENQLNLLAEGRISGRHFTAAAIPTTGSFARGDIIWSSAPTAGGTVGWICVTAGSPGTLKAFGDVAP